MKFNFNVVLDKEQMDEIASITADKVLETVEYQKTNEDWYEEKIKELKQQIQKRDSMLVQKDLVIERLRDSLRRTKEDVKMLNNYLVVFYAKEERDILYNDIIEYPKDISSIQDIRNVEKIIANKWFGDDRDITLINYKNIR